MTCFELGCMPGGFLLYFAKEFGYRVGGIDWGPGLPRLRGLLEGEGAEVVDLIQADFLQFRNTSRYDVVASFGFVEHFSDSADAVRKQLSLVNDGGFGVVEIPNLAGLMGALRAVADPQDFSRHNLELMNPHSLRLIFQECGFRILFCDYFRTVDFWLGRTMRSQALAITIWPVVKALELLHLDNVPNRELSPYVVCVGRRLGRP